MKISTRSYYLIMKYQPRLLLLLLLILLLLLLFYLYNLIVGRGRNLNPERFCWKC